MYKPTRLFVLKGHDVKRVSGVSVALTVLNIREYARNHHALARERKRKNYDRRCSYGLFALTMYHIMESILRAKATLALMAPRVFFREA